MKKLIRFEDMEVAALKAPEIKAEYDRVELGFVIASAMIKARAEAGLT